ncbi:hypothetical protein [Nonomuraea rubra]|uniref:hypothetical protein n=1 Tax=Nonomuraea rubra TaxID=46180 RepID=UPI0033EB358C
MVLLTGDKDFVPLVDRLIELGRHVVVPRMPPPVATAAELVTAASAAPLLSDLLAEGVQDDYAGVPVLIASAAASTSGGNDLRGTITRWLPGETSGFITDSGSRSWFVSRDSLPAGDTSLPKGTRVRFHGRPEPKPGKRYPEAFSVRVLM